MTTRDTDADEDSLAMRAFLEMAEQEVIALRDHLPTLRPDDETVCSQFELFAKGLCSASALVGFSKLESSASALWELFERSSSSGVPTAKFRFRVFTALEVVAVEIRAHLDRTDRT